MNTPLISIVIPAYNSEKYISRCVESVISQTYKNLEIIIVDDGSTDGTGEIADEFGAKDSRIRVIHAPHSGLVWCRKKGVEVSHGDFISHVDSDDWLDINRYQEVYEKGIQYGADIISTDVVNVYSNKHQQKRKVSVFPSNYGHDDIMEKIVCNMFDTEHFCRPIMSFASWSYIIKRDLILAPQMSINDEIVAREAVLLIVGCLLRAKCLAVIEGGTYYYFKHSSSLDHTYNPDIGWRLALAHSSMRNWLKDVPIRFRKRLSQQIDLLEYSSYLISDYELLYTNELDDEVFPYAVKVDRKIAIYGAGTLGVFIKKHLEYQGRNTVMWCDKSYSKYIVEGKEVHPPSDLLGVDFDVLLVAILNFDIAFKAKNELIDLGIDEKKIKLMDPAQLTGERLYGIHKKVHV